MAKIDVTKPLAPGRVRCQCCNRSMKRLKRDPYSYVCPSQMHYACLVDHVTGRCADYDHRIMYEMCWREMNHVTDD